MMKSTSWRKFALFALCVGVLGSVSASWRARDSWETRKADSPSAAGSMETRWSSPAASESARSALAMEDYGRMELCFIENQGQLDKSVKYYAMNGAQTIYFTPDQMVIALRQPNGTGPSKRLSPAAVHGKESYERYRLSHKGHGSPRKELSKPILVTMQPVGARKDAQLVPLELQAQKINYFIGKDPAKWHTNIPAYSGVVYREAYPGIDLKFYGRDHHLEYDIVVKPGADPEQVRFAFDGIERMEITSEGNLALRMPDGSLLVQRKPCVYQEIAGERQERDGRFTVHQGTTQLLCSFEIADYDSRYPLVIDPVLLYYTDFGGSGWKFSPPWFGVDETAYRIVVDGEGNAYVTGNTFAPDFPVKDAYQETYGGGDFDAFVAKLSPRGTLIYSTFLGGSDDEEGLGIALDQENNIYVAGVTLSSDFPTHNALQSTHGSEEDGFVTKLNPEGNVLVYSTFLGGNSSDSINAVAVDGAGHAFVTGFTSSANFPYTIPLFAYGVPFVYEDVFVAKLDPSGEAIVYSLILGRGEVHGIAVDSDGQAYVTGDTYDPGFHTTGEAFQSKYNYGGDAFVTKFYASGWGAIYSTFLGGNMSESGWGIAIDSAGNAYVAGATDSSDFPTRNAFQPLYAHGSDAFVTKFSPSGDLVFSTYLGTNFNEGANDIAVGSDGSVYVTGSTQSKDFPTFKPLNTSISQNFTYGTFVTQFAPEGDALVFSSLLASTRASSGFGIDVDACGQIYLAGYTTSSPINWQAHQVFVAKIGPSAKSLSPIIDLLLSE
jgi:hypothetical protein